MHARTGRGVKQYVRNVLIVGSNPIISTKGHTSEPSREGSDVFWFGNRRELHFYLYIFANRLALVEYAASVLLFCTESGMP